MSARTRTVLMLLGAVSLLGPSTLSCDDACPPGYYRQEGQCQPGMPITCGPGTVEQSGVCTAVGTSTLQCGKGTQKMGDLCVPSYPTGVNGSRFNSLALVEPKAVAGIVNVILDSAVKEGDILLLYKPREVAGGPPRIRDMSFGTGIAVEEEGITTYLLDPAYSYARATVQADQSFVTDEFVFAFQILPEDPGGILVLDRTVASCWLMRGGLIEPDTSCTVSGGLTPENAHKICLEGIACVDELLENVPKTVDCDRDGAADDCWTVTAHFKVTLAVVDDMLPL